MVTGRGGGYQTALARILREGTAWRLVETSICESGSKKGYEESIEICRCPERGGQYER